MVDRVYVTWDPGDPLNPVNWSKTRKYVTTVLAVFMSFYASTCAGIYGLGEYQMMDEFGASREVVILGISFYPLGFGFGPLVLAPLSELWGRNPVYFVAYIAFILFLLPQGVATNIQTVIIGRFMCGVASSTAATMVGGTIADLFEDKDRGPAMALFGAATMIGSSFGPLISGFIIDNPSMGWRWTVWIQMILNGAHFIVLLCTFKETRNSIALRSKARKKRKETGNPNFVAPIEMEKTPLLQLMKISLFRPLKFLFTEPILFFFTLWISFAWGILYLFLQTVGQIFEVSHGFSASQIGLCFLGMAVGGFIGALSNPLQEMFVTRSAAKRGGHHLPESRLVMSAAAGVIFSAGLFFFGWTSGPNYPWILPIVALGMVTFAIHAIYTAVFNYTADCYSIYASSALAGQSFGRCMFASAFPLFSEQMNTKLGFQWSMSLLGFIGLAMTTIPFILIWKGPAIRSKSKISQKLIELRPDDVHIGEEQFEEGLVGIHSH